ncbi:hypothetical protein OCU04_006308 [Sclerotinia nivalis]|uniref:2EXR domain-containing protein n=1 Tax=Sclerotinia nivalis TaxID=352851 RepID=A0A9X0ANL3_9HELO|nr:hypothetical protein OCU04_006308 [Sclerotinia nivalis]
MSWSELPVEIRLAIWEFTFSGPRTFTIRTNRMEDMKNKIPVAFHVNYESRKQAEEKMQLLFDGTNLVGSENCHFLYFNPKIDTLFLNDDSDLGRFQFLIGPCWNQRWLDSFGIRRRFPYLAIENLEPIKECDMVTLLKVWRGIAKMDQICFFRNLEKLTVLYDGHVLTSRIPNNTPLIQRIRMMEDRLIDDAKFIYGLCQKRLNEGFITKIPEIILSPIFAEAHEIVSSGVSTLKFRMPRNARPAVTMNEHVKDLDCAKSYNDGLRLLRH